MWIVCPVMTRYPILLHYWNHLHSNYGLALCVIGIVSLLVMLCNGLSLITWKTLPDGRIKEVQSYTPTKLMVIVGYKPVSQFAPLSSLCVLVFKPLMQQKNNLNCKCDRSTEILFKNSSVNYPSCSSPLLDFSLLQYDKWSLKTNIIGY